MSWKLSHITPIYKQKGSVTDPCFFSGARDCGTAIAFTAIQALELQWECRIISLDTCRAFNSVWWAGF